MKMPSKEIGIKHVFLALKFVKYGFMLCKKIHDSKKIKMAYTIVKKIMIANMLNNL